MFQFFVFFILIKFHKCEIKASNKEITIILFGPEPPPAEATPFQTPHITPNPTISASIAPPRTISPTFSPIVIYKSDGSNDLMVIFITLTSVAVVGAIGSGIYFLSSKKNNGQVAATTKDQDDVVDSNTKTRFATVPVKSIYSVNTVVL